MALASVISALRQHFQAAMESKTGTHYASNVQSSLIMQPYLFEQIYRVTTMGLSVADPVAQTVLHACYVVMKLCQQKASLLCNVSDMPTYLPGGALKLGTGRNSAHLDI